MNRKIISILGLTIGVLFSSCSSKDKLEYLSKTCGCKITEHYSISTNKEDNNIKEFSFIDSPLFKEGVPKFDFAQSFAILINHDWGLDSTTVIKVTLLKNVSGENKTTSFEFDKKELEKMAPKYFESLALVNSFVENIYNDNYQECYKFLGFEIAESKFDDIMNQIKNGLEKGYVDTRIISFNKVWDTYKIYGVVLTEDNTIDLFRMELKETDNELKIFTFYF